MSLAENDISVAASDGHPVIRVRGARVHNLRNVDVDIPRDRLVVITGPSGSGKSSLAFDTLFAEGQRQYIESLSVYARQFLDQLERPDVDLIDGLQPTISIDQRAGSTNPRSTVATVTEVYDYLRLLMARLGEPTCHQCGASIRQQSPEQIRDRLMALPSSTKLILLAPLVRGRKGQHKEIFDEIRKAGLVRARVDGEVVDLDHLPELSVRKNHTIEAVVDRIVIREGVEPRLAESINLALRHGEGRLIASYLLTGEQQPADPKDPASWQEELFSTLYACPNCNISFEEIEPRTFSFNSPYGACPACEGLGVRVEFDPGLVILDESHSLASGAVVAWKGVTAAQLKEYRGEIEPFLAGAGVTWETPISDLEPRLREQLFEGDGKSFLGILTMLEKEYATAVEATKRSRLEVLRTEVVCKECGGARLKQEARSVRLAGKAIHEITRLTARQATEFFQGIQFRQEDQSVGEPLVREIVRRLAFLDNVGVEYLTLDRPADTLSGGELQRVRLATGIGSGLIGVCYVLDEPSIGLHPRDNGRLIDALRALEQQGNTVLVVEHDEAMMRAADHLIDIGPGAGVNGGRIVAEGTPEEVIANEQSITGRYLAGVQKIAVPPERRRVAKSRSITVEGASANNLKNIDVQIPLGLMVCITGVSGSGKSSLVNETLARALRRRLYGEGPRPGAHTSLRGVNQIDKVIEVDQSPIGRTSRSNPATYTGAFDEIRKVFAGTKEARQRGFKTGRFSFNVKGGRCEECQGYGIKKIEMNFLPDLVVTCPECNGARFNRQTLQVRYRDKSIADVLNMSIDDAIVFFENFGAIARLMFSLQQVGLGYLTLGQSSATLSGGEAQRIKLATEMARVETGSTLYILDEPTTGLHFDDVRHLLGVLNRLVDLGNTVLVIEHNLDVIKSADWLVDLGPEGGEQGGYRLAEGTPEEIAAIEGNATGMFLAPVLK